MITIKIGTRDTNLETPRKVDKAPIEKMGAASTSVVFRK